MKKIYHYFIFLLAMVCCLHCFTACDDNSDLDVEQGDGKGKPIIDNVSLYTLPEKRDSAVHAIYADSLLLIDGNNLKSLRQIYFNGYKASLNAAYISNKTVLVKVPTLAPNAATAEDPTTITNKMVLVTDHGQVEWDLTIMAPPPVVYAVSNQNIRPGDKLKIYGANFHLINDIEFPNNKKVSEFTVDKKATVIEVMVPDYDLSASAHVLVNGRFGTGKHIINDCVTKDKISYSILNFDGIGNFLWGSVIDENIQYNFPGNTGQYAVMAGGAGSNTWWEGSRSINMDFTDFVSTADVSGTDIADWVLRFEANFSKFEDARVRFGITDPVGGASWIYSWMPWQEKLTETEGWQTFSFPLEAFVQEWSNPSRYPARLTDILRYDGFGQFQFLHLPEEGKNDSAAFEIGFDNIRLVNTKREAEANKSIANME